MDVSCGEELSVHFHLVLVQDVEDRQDRRSSNAKTKDTGRCADVAVKHAVPLAPIPLAIETRDLSERSLADAIIVSGTGTGAETDISDLKTVKENTHLPVIIGSGTTPSNLRALNTYADGYIVGSYFKHQGKADNDVDPARVRDFLQVFRAIS